MGTTVVFLLDAHTTLLDKHGDDKINAALKKEGARACQYIAQGSKHSGQKPSCKSSAARVRWQWRQRTFGFASGSNSRLVWLHDFIANGVQQFRLRLPQPSVQIPLLLFFKEGLTRSAFPLLNHNLHSSR